MTTTTPTTTPLIQNFSLPAGDEMAVHFTVNPDGVHTLIGASIAWFAYEQKYGMITNTTPIISKALDAGIEINDPVTWELTVTLDEVDTENLLNNYRHALKITIGGNTVTVADGIMTVTESK